MFQIPSIASSEDKDIKVENMDLKAEDMLTADDSSASIISTSSSSDGYCSDHPDCDSWGPATFEESGALDELLAEEGVRKLPSQYDMEQLVCELAACTTTDNTFYVVDLSTVMSKLNVWKKALPRTSPCTP